MKKDIAQFNVVLAINGKCWYFCVGLDELEAVGVVKQLNEFHGHKMYYVGAYVVPNGNRMETVL